MPVPCFSYSSDMNHGPAGWVPSDLRRMPTGPCFSYSADGPPRDLRRMPYSCFSFSAGDLRRMPDSVCFSLSAGDLRRMPVGPCFSYPADLPPGVRKRN